VCLVRHECHFHNDTGCAIANAYAALEAAPPTSTPRPCIGDVKNGINLSWRPCCPHVHCRQGGHQAKYNLHKLRDLENLVADMLSRSRSRSTTT